MISNRSIWPINWNLTGTTTHFCSLLQSRPKELEMRSPEFWNKGNFLKELFNLEMTDSMRQENKEEEVCVEATIRELENHTKKGSERLITSVSIRYINKNNLGTNRKTTNNKFRKQRSELYGSFKKS